MYLKITKNVIHKLEPFLICPKNLIRAISNELYDVK